MNNLYELDLTELKSYYEELELLFQYKRKLIDNYLMEYDNDNDVEYLDYLMTRKIIEMKK